MPIQNDDGIDFVPAQSISDSLPPPTPVVPAAPEQHDGIDFKPIESAVPVEDDGIQFTPLTAETVKNEAKSYVDRNTQEHEDLVNRYVDQFKKQYGEHAALNVGINKATNVFGLPEWVDTQLDKLKGMTSEDISAKKEALQKISDEHPTASMVGELGKTGTEMLGTVPLGTEAAELIPGVAKDAPLISKILNIGAKGAASMTAMDSPETVKKIINGDLPGAVENVGKDIAIGSLFDIAATPVLKGVGKIVEKLTPSINTWLEAAGVNILKDVPTEAKKQAFEQTFREIIPENYTKLGQVERGKVVEKLMKENGEQIGSLIKKADEVSQSQILFNAPEIQPDIQPEISKEDFVKSKLDVINPEENVDMKKVAEDANAEWDKKYGTSSTPIPDNTIPTKAELQPNLRSVLKEVSGVADQATTKAQLNIIKDAQEAITRKIDKIEAGKVGIFEGTKALASEFAATARESADGSVEKLLSSKVSHIINEELNLSLARTFQAAGDVKSLGELQKASRAYSMLKTLNPLEKQAFSANTVANPIGGARGGAVAMGARLAVGGGIGAALNKFAPEDKRINAGIATLLGAGFFGVLGGKAVKYWWENTGNFATKDWLRKFATSETLPSLTILKSLTAGKVAINEIPKVLQAMNDDTKHDADFEKGDPITKFLGDEANGLTKEQQYQRLVDKVLQTTSNPEAWNAHKKDVLSIFHQFPTLQAAVDAHWDNTAKVIKDTLPPQPAPQAFQPASKSKPTTQQMNDVKDVLRLANNPHEILKDLQDGTITPKKVAMVAQMYPTTLKALQAEYVKNAFSGKYDLSYQQRLASSILMGAPMDTSLTEVSALQAVANVPTNQPSPGGKANRTHHGSKEGSASFATSSQRTRFGIK